MGRKPNTEVRRKQIMEGLQRVMAEKGYAGASIQAIGKACGLTPGLIHYHFKSKQDILIGLVAQLDQFAQDRLEAMPKSDDPVEAIRQYITARLALGEGSDHAIVATWVLIGSEAVKQPEVRRVYQEVLKKELELLTRLLTHMAQFRDVVMDPHLPAIVLAAVEGTFQLSASAGDLMPRGYAAPQIWAIIDKSLT